MPIRLQCSCGKQLRLKDDTAGKKVRCPDCREIMPVPVLRREAATRPTPVAKARTAAVGGDGGELDFGELAELERAADVVQDEFPVQCPRCAQAFAAQAASRNAKTTCPKCEKGFRIGDHPAGQVAVPQSASELTEACMICGKPTDIGRTTCNKCAAERKASISVDAGDVLEEVSGIGVVIPVCIILGLSVISAIIIAIAKTSLSPAF